MRSLARREGPRPVLVIGAALLVSVISGVTMSGRQAAPAAGTARAERMRVQVIQSYPHDRGAFTQGLLVDGGKLFESTGLVGRSSLREVDLATGRVIRKVDVPPPVFAEGLAASGDSLVQLTWQTQPDGVQVKTLVDRGLGRLLLQALRFPAGASLERPAMLAALVVDGQTQIDGEHLSAWDFIYASADTDKAPIEFQSDTTLLAVTLR